MEVPQEIIDRLKKLFALEEGALSIGSIHEAEVASLKAQELLLKWNLEKSDLKQEEQKIVNRILEIGKLYKKCFGDYIPFLVNGLAQYNLCKAVLLSSNRGKEFERIIIFGERNNLEILEFLIFQLKEKIEKLAKLKYKALLLESNPNSFYRAFCSGAVGGLIDKLRKELEKFKDHDLNCSALVLSNKEQLKDAKNKYFDDWGKFKISKPNKLSDSDGFLHGWISGQNLDINKGLNKSNTDVLK